LFARLPPFSPRSKPVDREYYQAPLCKTFYELDVHPFSKNSPNQFLTPPLPFARAQALGLRPSLSSAWSRLLKGWHLCRDGLYLPQPLQRSPQLKVSIFSSPPTLNFLHSYLSERLSCFLLSAFPPRSDKKRTPLFPSFCPHISTDPGPPPVLTCSGNIRVGYLP